MHTKHKMAAVIDNETVEEWICEARAGSAAALGRLTETYRNYLLSIANKSLPEKLRAKVGPSDLVQDTALEAHRDFASFDGMRAEELLGWLRRMLLNNVVNIVRHYEKTEKRKIAREKLEIDGVGVNDLQSRLPSPSSQIEALDERLKLDRCLSRLPANMSKVIILRNREYLSFEEIGLQMQRSVAAARKLWARAIERLADEITSDGENDGQN